MEKHITTDINTLKEGQIIEGTVKSIIDIGAIIDIGIMGIDALLRLADMSWSKVRHADEVISLNQKIDVMVLEINLDLNRVIFGLKQTTENPWRD